MFQSKTGLKIARAAIAASIIQMKHEERSYPPGHPLRHLLNKHRHGQVRPTARALNLACGFLRGRDLRQVEQVSYQRPKWNLVLESVLQFSPEDPRIISQRLAQWIDEADLPVNVAPRQVKVEPQSVADAQVAKEALAQQG